jgi:hypothetical protein
MHPNPQNSQDSIQQFGLTYGLRQVGSYAEIPTSGSVAAVANGRQHQDGSSCKFRILFNPFCQSQAIHFGHLCVGEQVIGCPIGSPGTEAQRGLDVSSH